MAATVDSIRALAERPPMQDMKTRQEIYNAARELMFAVEPPIETDNRIFYAYTGMAFAEIASDLKLFETLAADTEKEWKVEELAEKSGADPVLLHRILRYLAATALISEPTASVYKASHLTPHVASPVFYAGLKHNILFTNPPFRALPSVLKDNGYQNLVGSKTCAFQRGLNTTDNIMEHLASHPEQAGWTAAYMAAHKSETNTWMDGSVPLKDFTLSSADVEKGRAMMVDVGGGSGHQLISLRAAQPQLKGRMVVQDVDMMIATVDKAAAEKAGVEAMVHDFYTPQPVKGAKVYYLRSVLHDWTDDLCTKILLRLREAMAEDSVIALDEIVIPDKGAKIIQMHFDLAMLAALGARERSESQWAELLSTAGLKIRDVWTYDEGLGGSLIVAIPA